MYTHRWQQLLVQRHRSGCGRVEGVALCEQSHIDAASEVYQHHALVCPAANLRTTQKIP